MLSDDDINSPVKIIDFGLATIHGRNDPPMTAFAGSAFTVSPEVIKRRYGRECDLWSVGIIAYFLLTSRMPFNAKSDKEIFQKVCSGEYGYPTWTKTGLSEEAKDFIDRLIVVNPKRRLTAKQALSHIWIRKFNQTRLAGSTNSEELALVPMGDRSIVPRVSRPQQQRLSQPREPRMEQRHRRGGPPDRHRRVAQQQRPTAAATAGVRKNPRRSPNPAAEVGDGGSMDPRGQHYRRPVGRAA